jgi:elongation factor G
VFDAVQGVEPQSETVWRQANRYHVPRICFANKMDRVGASFETTIASIEERLGARPLAMQVPIGSEDSFIGVVDLLTEQAILFEDELGSKPQYTEIPEDLVETVKERRAELVERIAELDDALTLKYLEGEPLTIDELKAALRQGVLDNEISPVFCGSSLKNKGVQPLLDAVVDYLPSPLDVPDVIGHHPKTGDEITRPPKDSAPPSALVFKIVTDAYVGRLAYIRVYSGTIKKGNNYLNATQEKRERVGRLLRMYADHREDVKEIHAGDIGAILGLKESFTGDTLSDINHPIVLETINFPEPVISVAIEPKTLADQDKMSIALQKLAEEDPTFKVRVDEETGQTIISGMGELHLDILVDRMLREFKVQANVGNPRVAYHETITQTVPESEYKFVKQTGGHGQYGHVVLRIEPLESGSGFIFEDEIRGGAVPREYIPAVQKGVEEAIESGVVSGYPMTDLKVTLLDGSFHEVDSSDMAFRMAAIFAFREGAPKGKPVLLEPIMKVEVVVPEDHTGEVLGQINSRHGNVLGMDVRPGKAQAIHAEVPLAEMFGYATELRSATKGRGVFTMEFDHYAPVSEVMMKKIAGL